MLRMNRQRPGSTPHCKLATGSGAVLIALLFSGAACQQGGTEAPAGGSGGSSSPSTGGKSGGSSNTGGTSATGGSGSSATGGSSPSAGGGSGSGTGGSAGGSGDTGGSPATGGATGGGDGDASPPAGTGGTAGGGGGTVGAMPTCTEEPAATVPALKATPLPVKLPGGDQAGQVVGVPGEKGIYVLGHRTGKVYYVVDGKLDPTPMAQVTVKNNPGQDEQGLLAIALHPNFKENQLFYLLYTTPNIHIQELKRTGMTSSMMTKVVWDKPRVGTGAFHNGGQISFSSKDNGKALLYHSVGNTSSAGGDEPEGTVGRILIHDIDAGTAKTLGHGLRNPYRLHVDRLTGDMYVGETNGPAGGTIRFSPLASPVTDYGFPKGGNQGATVPSPFAGIEGGKALIGGVVYRGSKIPGICGRYFYAGWDGGDVKSLVAKDGKATKAPTGITVPKIASFGEDGDGEIYMSTMDGEIYKLEAM
jgi:glucose/arabinose dehydrogenase